MLKRYISGKRFDFIAALIGIVVAAVSFPFLPQEIPMQWNKLEVNWYSGKIAIFALPVVSIFLSMLSNIILTTYADKYPPLLGEFLQNIISGVMVILISCEIYTAAFCFGFRWRLDFILIAEAVILAAVIVVRLIMARRKLEK